MDMASLVEELAKAYIDGMPLETIDSNIKDIVTTYNEKFNTIIVDIYLQNSFIIIIYLKLDSVPTFSINGNYIGKGINEIINYFKLLGFKEIKRIGY